jgi:hypothetical protein
LEVSNEMFHYKSLCSGDVPWEQFDNDFLQSKPHFWQRIKRGY